MTKQEILSRLEPCLDKALLDEIKAVFEREEKMAQFMKNMKDAFTACTAEISLFWGIGTPLAKQI